MTTHVEQKGEQSPFFLAPLHTTAETLTGAAFILFLLGLWMPATLGPVNLWCYFLAIAAMALLGIQYRIPVNAVFQVHPISRKLALDAFLAPALYLAVVLTAFTVLGIEEPQDTPIYKMKEQSPVLLGMLALLAAVYEELFFRGIVYPACERRMGMAPAVVFVTAWFGLIHGWQNNWFMPVVLGITGASFIFTGLRAVTRSVTASIVAHITFNGIQIAMMLLLLEIP